MSKKIVAINSNYPLLRTGLGKNTKYVLDYLYRTGKYEIVLYCMGLTWQHPDFARLPYKVYGCLPNDPQTQQEINQSDEGAKRAWAYGQGLIDNFIREVKPTHMIFSDDVWAFNGYTEKQWFHKINSILHLTIDSIPIIPSALDMAKKAKNYYVWNSFAEDEMHRLGFNHVKTIPGCVNEKELFRLNTIKRSELRKKFDLPIDSFIIGSDSRNQLRKEWPALLEGFSIFLKENPTVKNAYLFLITTHNEGWSITRYLEEFNIPKDRFLALYLCQNCREIEVRPLAGQNLDCKFCKANQSQQTIRIDYGCTETQLNQAYNLFDAFCHVFNAGGLEMCLPQSLYCEIPLATVDYSSGSFFTKQPFVHTIDSAYTRQIGTEFKRACPYPYSIAKYIKKMYNMPEDKRRELGKAGREWAISVFSPEVVGKQWEKLIDSLPVLEYDYDIRYIPKNDKYPFKGAEFTNDADFIIDMYQKILFLPNENTPEADGVKGWVHQLKNGRSREDVWKYFIGEAAKDNANNTPYDLGNLFDKTRPNKRALMVIPESLGDCIANQGLYESFHTQYPETDLYIATKPQNFEIFEGNPHIFRVIPYHDAMERELFMVGAGDYKGHVDIYLHATIPQQRQLNYLSNSNPVLP